MWMLEARSESWMWGVAVCTVAVVGTGCDASDGGTQADCVPSEAAYEANSAAILLNGCGSCHGSEPQFGAPYSLVEGYADLVAGDPGSRKVDAIVAELLDGTMPPANAEQLSHNDLDTLAGWASCGLSHPTSDDELVATREIWDAPEDPPDGTTAADLTADNEEVGLDAIDDYRHFEFSNVVTEAQYIRRIEPVIDESRVLHHITLAYAPGFPYLYAWAPGTGAIEFPDGGVLVEPDDEFVLEIHYNNGAGIADAVDNSGIRLWIGDTVGTEYGMMAPSTWDMVVPAGERRSFTQSCTASMDFEIVAGMPHMHQIGSTFRHEVERPDGEVETIIDLSGWSFESQYFYEMGVQVEAGDTLRMTCGYHNTTDQQVVAGEATTDEMCFDFMVVTPAAAAQECAEGLFD